MTDFEIFVHANGRKPVAVMVADDNVLADVLERIGLGEKELPDTTVSVGEAEDVGDDDTDDRDDDHDAVDIRQTVAALRLRELRHVHVSRCRRVAVEVNFGGKDRRRKVRPAVTVGAMTRWARRVFKLDPASAAEYVLQLCGTTEQPRPDVHIGELTSAPTCSVCFDLVKEVTPQG